MGALSLAMRPRFEDGGIAGGGDVDETPMAPPAPQAPPAGPRGALSLPAGAAAAPQGALGPAMSPDNVDPQAAQRLARIQAATAVLQAGSVIPSQQAGAVNVPLLTAAGALLAPTRTGGFAESLGSAMTQGATALQHQRQQDEQARLRMLQQQQLADYRQGLLGVQGTRADAYAMNAQTRDWVARQTLAYKAQGMSDLAAYRQALIDAQNRRIDTQSEDRRYNTDQRVQQADRVLDARRAQWLVSNDAKAQAQRLAALNIDARLINSAMLAASRDIGVITGKVAPGVVIDKWLREQGKALAASPSAGSPHAGAAPAPAEGGAAPAPVAVPRAALPEEINIARQAIAQNPANRAKVLERFRQNNVQPPPDL